MSRRARLAPCAMTMPNSETNERNRLIMAGRSTINPWRTRRSVSTVCWSIVLTGTNRMLGRVERRVALHDQACPAGSEGGPNPDWSSYGHRRMGRPDDPVHRTRDLVVLLGQWHTAELGCVRVPCEGRLSELRAASERAGLQSAGVLLRGTQGDAQTRADYRAFLHSGMVWRGQVGRCSHAPHPGHREADT